MTKQDAFYQSQINSLGISIYPVPSGTFYTINIGYHFNQDITNTKLIKEIKGTIKYPTKGEQYALKIRELYKHLYHKKYDKP